MRKRRQGTSAVRATVEAEAFSEALRSFGLICSSPALVVLKYIFGVSDRALAAALRVTEMQTGNYIRGLSTVPEEREALAVEALRRALAVSRDVLKATDPTSVVSAVPPFARLDISLMRTKRRVDQRAAYRVLAAKIAAGEMVLAAYDKKAS